MTKQPIDNKTLLTDGETWSYQAVVIGVSAGGMDALLTILPELPVDYSLVVVIVLHLRDDVPSTLAEVLNRRTDITVIEAFDKEPINSSTVYIAPPGYHLLIEENRTFSLTVEPQVNYARPSIDVLFDSAADVYQDRLVGVILTGCNTDGALGLEKIKSLGGLTLCQDPTTAKNPEMPQAAIDLFKLDQILPLDQIGPYLAQLNSVGSLVPTENSSRKM